MKNDLTRFIRSSRPLRCVTLLALVCLLSACATRQPQVPRDYSAFRESRPRSILVLPPVNRSPEVKASASVFAVAPYPLAESGYYVIPVTLVEEVFRQNGVTVAEEAQALPPDKLRAIFGADAALYITIERYGVSYRLIESVVELFAAARLVDLRTGQELWQGRVNLVVGQNNNSNGLIAMLLSAAINQIANTLSDSSHTIARAASQQLLFSGNRDNMLYGPYHPRYGTD
jgi:hypothetical protein